MLMKQHKNRSGPKSDAPAGILQRKNCSCGRQAGPTGECAGCRRKGVQTKLRISRPGDKYEQEADRVAATIMRAERSSLPAISKIDAAVFQRQPIEEEEEEEAGGPVTKSELMSMKEVPGHSHTVTPAVERAVSNMEGGGSALDRNTRQVMESRFGHQFGAVRIHTDGRADATAKQINARAFTIGRHIGFASGEYQPHTPEGQTLLAHELTHVIQQGGRSGAIMRTCNCTTGRRATAAEHSSLSGHFPRLASDNYCIIGPKTPTYNCIAWSVSDVSQWIWNQVDNPYGDADGTVTISDFDAFYWAKQRLVPTDYPNSNSLVALFATSSGPTHAALTSTGAPNCGAIPFTSKLGRSFLISHDLNELEGGSTYGNVVRYYEPG